MNVKVLFIAVFLLIPGCIEDIPNPEEHESIVDRGYTNISMQIFHGESVENATTNFTITIKLDHSAAPIHAENMVKHVTAGNYNMTHFHRIIDDFMIQGGDFENHDGTGGYAADWYGYCNGQSMSDEADCSENSWTIPDEADNGLQHLACTISMAKTSQPNTGGSQFFLMPDDITHHAWLDGVHTVFGEVTDGCEHITTISEVSTGDYDRPIVPVVILSVTVLD